MGDSGELLQVAEKVTVATVINRTEYIDKNKGLLNVYSVFSVRKVVESEDFFGEKQT